MSRVVKCLSVCFFAAFFTLGATAAETRVVVIWNCEANDGISQDDLQAVNGRWVRFANKEVDGGDIRSFLTSAIIGDPSKFKYIDSFPSLDSWAAMDKAMNSDEGRSIDTAFNAIQKCSKNTLHRAVESE